MLHVADHHVVPGKKQWTWGNGDFGRAWDRQLTDDDGPYIELMCGAYTDNQPDFSWLAARRGEALHPGLHALQAIGPAKNAIGRGRAQPGVVPADGCGSAYYVTQPRTVHGTAADAAGECSARRRQTLDPGIGADQTRCRSTVALARRSSRLQRWSLHAAGRRHPGRLYAPARPDSLAIPAPATPARPPQRSRATKSFS